MFLECPMISGQGECAIGEVPCEHCPKEHLLLAGHYVRQDGPGGL